MNQISRRKLLQAGTAAIAARVIPAQAAGLGASRQPNILWLVSEDNNPFIGAYGDKLARTPTIDGLASQGILFRNVYSTAPVCAPSRFAIITGVYPESSAPANHMRAKARLPATLQAFTEYLRKAGYYCSNNAKTDYNCDIDPKAVWDDSSSTAHWRNRPQHKPFFAVFNYETTHESELFKRDLFKLKPIEGKVRPEDVQVPAYMPDTQLVRRDIANYYNLMAQMDGEIAVRLAELEADGLAQDTIVFYYSDNGGSLLRSKRYCYDEGLRCAMVVRVPERWSHFAPARPGSEVAAPITFIDLAPTVLALAGIDRPPQMQGGAFLGAAPAPAARYAFGMRNRMDERYDFIRTATDGRYRYIRNYMPHRIWGQHQAFAWLAKGYQDWERQYRAGRLNAVQARFFREKPFEEFYDLQSDPDQVRNLINQPTQQGRIEAIRQALTQHMLNVNDNGFIPEGSPLEGYAASRALGAYPLRELIALAEVAARRDSANLGLLQKRLGDSNEAVRYWAAQGLLMLGKAAAPALAQLQEMMRADASLQVRIVAAETIAGLAEPAEAVALLGELTDPSRTIPVRLQALNALTFLGEKARPALPAITRAAQDQQEYVHNAGRYLQLVLEGSYDPAAVVIDLPALVRAASQQK